MNALLSLLRMSLDGKPAEFPSGVDWSELMKVSENQSVGALVYDGVRSLPPEKRPPSDLMTQWRVRTLLKERGYQKQWSAAKELGEMLHEAGIRVFVLKGFTLSTLYPCPNHRSSTDVDIYCINSKGDCCGEMADNLASDFGCKVLADHYKHSHFRYKSIFVENHRHILPVRGSREVRRLEKNLLDCMDIGPQYIDGSFLERPSPLFMSVYLLAHSQEHFLSWSIPLRHICDWAVFLRHISESSVDLDWELWKRLCIEYGLLEYGYALTRLSKRICDFDIPFDCSEDEIADERILEDIFSHSRLSASSPFIQRIAMSQNIFRDRWKFRHFSNISAIRFAMRRIGGFIFDRDP